MKTAATIAGLSWSILHVFGFIYTLRLWIREQKRFYLWFSVSWFAMAVWGVSISGSNLVMFVNSVLIPPFASITGLIAMRYLDNHVKAKIVTILPRNNGAMELRTFSEDNRDTPVDPKGRVE